MKLYRSILIILQLILLCALTPFSDGRNCHPGRTATPSLLWRTPRGGARADEATEHEEEAAGSSPSSSCAAETIVLRIRLPNGSIERLAVSDLEHLRLRDVLAQLLLPDEVDNVFSVRQPDGSLTTDLSRSLQDLKVQNGSLLTLITTKSRQSASKKSSNRPSFALSKQPHRTFDPFPDLAKQNYEVALAKVKRSGARTGGSSYASLANLHQAMHTVEPQPEGRLFRIYMCAKSAARFQSNCLTVVSSSSKKKKKKSQQQSSVVERRCALLLGTIQKERRKPRVARTSLSSTTDEEQFGQAAKVHAVWEPSGTPNGDCLQTIPDNVLRVAKALGLQPVGWIFSYDGTREPERSAADDGLPVWAADVRTGAQLQAANMQRAQAADRPKKSSSSSSSSSDEYNDNGALFVTLAMDASTGATEAFQLSDVAVQMVAEDLLVVGGADDKKRGGAGRYCTTRNPVLVDGRETRELDSVLCLVNTALLSHEGLYAGASSSSSTKKKTGTLTSKARKAILKGLNNVNNNNESSSSSSSQEQLLETLCDFQILLALDDLLNASESEQLCQIIRKFARGQKRTTTVDEPLRQRIRRLLE